MRTKATTKLNGGIPEWPKGADCKSVASRFDGSNPSSSTIRWAHSSAGRAPALQAGGHRFEPCCAHHLNKYKYAGMAQR